MAHTLGQISNLPHSFNLLKKIKHPHPMIYLRGFQSNDLVAIVDFLYVGEANVFKII